MKSQKRPDPAKAAGLSVWFSATEGVEQLEQRSWRLFTPGGCGVVAGLAAVWATRNPEIADKLTALQENAISATGYVIAGLGLVAMVLGFRDSSRALGRREAALHALPPVDPMPDFSPDLITTSQASQIDGYANPEHPIDPDRL